MSKAVELPWGAGTLEVPLPKEWRVLGELKPKTFSIRKDLNDACAEALKHPIGAPPIGSRDLAGKRVTLVVDDHSRPTPVREFIRPVLDELAAAGARDEDVRIVIACGVHRASRPEEVERKLGREVMNRFRWSCHNAHDTEELADLGTTSRGTRVFLNKQLLESDLIVCVGSLEPHLLVGFGGGLKMIIPGCAGTATIGRNHLQGVGHDLFDYVGVRGENSPMRLDLEEGAGLLNREIFIVNAAVNEEAKPTSFFCGDPIQSHRAGELFVEEHACLTVPEQADVVVANSHPMNLDFRQSIKCVGNSLHAAKPEGVMLAYVRCEQGLGEMPLPKKTLSYNVMRTVLKVLGKKRILPLVERIKKDEPVEEVFISHFGLQMLRRNHLAAFSDSAKLPADVGRKLGLCRSFTDLGEMMAWAGTKAPTNATVWVVPFGGSSYARLDGNGKKS